MARTFAEAAIKIVADGSSLNKQLAGIEQAVRDSAGRMSSATKAAIAAIAGALPVAAAAAMVKMSADVGDELAKMSQRVAISAETLSGYRVAAQLSGTSLEDFGTSLQGASRNILDASRGTGEAADAFDALGIRVTDQVGKLKTAEQVMLEVADKFSKMEDGAQKTALAMDIFGRSGASMIPLLNQGSAALAAQRKEAEQLGATWTTAQAKLAEAFNGNLQRIEAGLAGFRNQVVTGLLPFFNDMLDAIVAKMKAWGESGELQAWAKRTSDAVINAIVAIAEFIDAHLVEAVELSTKTFLAMEIAARGVANGVLVLTNGILALVWAVNSGGLALRKLLGIEESLGVTTVEVEQRVDRFTTAIADNSRRIEEMSQGINRALADWTTPLSDDARKRLTGFAETASRVALQIREWADKAKAGGSETAKAIGEGSAKLSQQLIKSTKEQVKELDEAFKALSTRGEVSLQEQLSYLQKRASLFRQGSAERIQAEAEAFKAAQDLASRLFAHQQALGLKTLQDAIAFEQGRAAAAKVGSEARMKADEAVFQKQEELRNKARQAALGILGEVEDRLAERGVTSITQVDVQRELMDLQQERARQFRETAGRFAGGGLVDIGELMQGIQAGGKLEDLQKQLGQFGGLGGIFGGAAQLPAGPLMEQLGLMGGGPGGALATAFETGMDRAATAVDEGLTRIEERVNDSSSRIAKTIYGNIEDWFVRRLTAELKRA